MRKSKLINKVLKERPEFINIGTFFFVKPIDHVLSGFCCETTPGGAYIWKCVYPLFDKFDCLSLLYSQRLNYPEGYIDFDKIDKNNLADEFLLRIDEYVHDAYQYLTLEQFCSLFEQRPNLLRHGRGQMALGYSLILLGEKIAAINHLTFAVARLNEPALAECRMILSLAETDFESAKLGVLNLEQQMKENIGLRSAL